MQFEGIYVPIITPFAVNGGIDYEQFGSVIDWQIDNGVHGLIVGGSTGEFFSLSRDERVEQLKFAADRINGRIPLIAGVNDLLIDSCYEITAAARDAGAGALLVAAPPYIQPGQEELLAHCLKIDRIADLPILLYNYPGRTGVSMDEVFLQRVAQNRNVCAIKESSGDIERVRMLARDYPQLQLIAGAEDQVLEFFAWGARGWVCVVANFFPRESVSFFETCVLRGDFDTGRGIMKAFLPLMNCLEKGGKFIQSVKYACELQGRPGGPARPPLRPMKKDARREVRQIVRTAGTALDETMREGNR